MRKVSGCSDGGGDIGIDDKDDDGDDFDEVDFEADNVPDYAGA